MAYPPILPPTGRTNATLEVDAHPSDHNLTAAALAAMPWGRVNGVVYTGAAQVIGASIVDLTGLSVPATLVVGRRYRVAFTASVGQSVAQGISNIILADSTNAVLTQPGTLLVPGGYATITSFVEFVAAVTARTFKLRAVVGAGSLSILNTAATPSVLVVDDVGL